MSTVKKRDKGNLFPYPFPPIDPLSMKKTQDHVEHNTNNNTADNRKIETAMLSRNRNVPRQMPQWEEMGAKLHKKTYHDK